MSVDNILIQLISNLFGNYWYLFFSYMIFNLLDWITGLIKAIKSMEVSSNKGTKGILQKLGYWMVIGIAFSFSSMFVIIGKEILKIDLSFMYLLGWFTFTLLLINEIISILENLVILGIKVPNILIRSLKATEGILDEASKKVIDKESDKKEN